MAFRIGDRIPADLCMLLNVASHEVVGDPLLVHIWSISCPACKFNMPHLQELRDKYIGNGLQIVSVHMPRSEAELEEEFVRKVANTIGTTETLILDNDHKIIEVFGVNAVPAYFLFDAEGKLRRHALGNFGVRMIGQAVHRLFGDVSQDMKE